MATGRNPRLILVSIATVTVLFGVLLVVSHLGSLGRYGYSLQTGWQEPAIRPPGECDRALTRAGFPLTTRRPANDSSGCLDSTNRLASVMNVAICFAAASILAVGVAEVIDKTYG